MNDYIKPTIKLASAASPRGISSCSTTGEDMELIQSIVGGGVDADKIFNSNEGCLIPVELEMFCKFTSAETGATQIFWS